MNVGVILTITSWGTKKLWGCGCKGKADYTDQAITSMDVDASEFFRDSKYEWDFKFSNDAIRYIMPGCLADV